MDPNLCSSNIVTQASDESGVRIDFVEGKETKEGIILLQTGGGGGANWSLADK